MDECLFLEQYELPFCLFVFSPLLIPESPINAGRVIQPAQTISYNLKVLIVL